ncbi:MAG: Interferon-induced transrane protein [Pedosphaera sp.]|nr:Interferon-induced transrane protein [Pedosphaera sp.]
MYKIIGANQVEYGPISADQLRQWIAEGRADANTQARLEGTSDWKPLRNFPEFAGSFPAQSSSVPPPFSTTGGTMPSVPNYLVQAILCTLCCCLPLGIVAIVYAAQVNGKLQAGDYQGALAASKNAKLWCWIAFGLGIVTNAIIIIIQFAAAGLSGFHQ